MGRIKHHILLDNVVTEDPQSETDAQNHYRNLRKRTADPDLDSTHCVTASAEEASLPSQIRVIVLHACLDPCE